MNHRLVGCLPVLLLVSQTYTTAQELPADTFEIEEIIITHSKVTQSARSAIKPVIVMTRDEIEKSGITDVSRLLHAIPGINVNGAYSNPAKDKSLYLQGGGSAYTLILMDGEPITDPSGIGGTFDLRLLNTAQIERIEVLKGSQSVFYGTDAIAGVINIVTRRPDQQGAQAGASLQYGSYNTVLANALYGDRYEKFDYHLQVGYMRSDGISEALADGSGMFDKDGLSSGSVQGGLGVGLSEALTIRTFLQYAQFDGDYDGGALTDAPNTYSSETFHPGIKAIWEKTNIRWEASYDYTGTDRVFDSSFGVDTFEGDFHNAETFLTWAIRPVLRVSGGLNYQSHRMLGQNATRPDPQTGIYGVFASIALTDTNLPMLEAGYRYNHHEVFGDHSGYTLSGGYWFGREIRAYASHSTGFKAPALFMLYGEFGANPDLLPQASRSWETGIDYFTADGMWQLRLNYFRRKIEDVIVFHGTQGYLNQDVQKDQGIDADINWKGPATLQLDASYSYISGRVTTRNASGDMVTHNNLIRQPRHRVCFGASYDVSDVFQITVDVEHHSKRTDLYFDPVIFSTEEVSLAPYTLINLHVAYTDPGRGLTVYGKIINLTDTDFQEVYGFSTVGLNGHLGARFALR